MPAVLTEVGFISNREEEKYINSEKGQDEIVDAIFAAIKTYKKNIEVKQLALKMLKVLKIIT